MQADDFRFLIADFLLKQNNAGRDFGDFLPLLYPVFIILQAQAPAPLQHFQQAALFGGQCQYSLEGLLGGSGTFFKCALGCAGVHFLKKGTAYFGIGNFHGTAPLQKLENRFAVLF